MGQSTLIALSMRLTTIAFVLTVLVVARAEAKPKAKPQTVKAPIDIGINTTSDDTTCLPYLAPLQECTVAVAQKLCCSRFCCDPNLNLPGPPVCGGDKPGMRQEQGCTIPIPIQEKQKPPSGESIQQRTGNGSGNGSGNGADSGKLMASIMDNLGKGEPIKMVVDIKSPEE